GVVFVRLGPGEGRGGAGEELLVVAARGEQAAVRLAHDDDVLHRRKLRRDRGEGREERRIDEDDAVPGVVRDPRGLVGVEPDVQRVENGSHARQRAVELLVPERVEGEGGDPVARHDAERRQRGGQAPDAPAEHRKRLPVNAVLGPGDDLLPREERHRAFEDPVDDERIVLHEPAHRDSFPASPQLRSARARTIRCTSLAPSTICAILASLKRWMAGNSSETPVAPQSWTASAGRKRAVSVATSFAPAAAAENGRSESRRRAASRTRAAAASVRAAISARRALTTSFFSSGRPKAFRVRA